MSLLGADPSRYRYSPERLKKAWPSQDEVSTHVPQGRRQSGKGWAVWAEGPGGGLFAAAFGAGCQLSGNARKEQDGCVWDVLSACRYLRALLAHQAWAAHLFHGPRNAGSLRPGYLFLAPLQLKPPSFTTWNTGSEPGVTLGHHAWAPAQLWNSRGRTWGKQVSLQVAPNPDRKYLLWVSGKSSIFLSWVFFHDRLAAMYLDLLE